MITDKLYKETIKYSNEALNKKGIFDVDGCDIVHDIIANGIDISESNYKKLILDEVFKLKRKTSDTITLDFNASYEEFEQKNDIAIVWKKCKRCPNELPESEFPKQTHSSSHSNICKECVSKRKAAYREKNKDKLKEQQRKWWHNHVDKNGQKLITAKTRKTKKDDTNTKYRLEKFRKIQTEFLGDWYIKRLIKRHDKDIVITEEMIALKRMQVIAFRFKKEMAR